MTYMVIQWLKRVIATGQTEELKKAWEEYVNEGDNTALEQAIRSWNPYLEVKINKETTTEVLNDFGNVVDKIESKVCTSSFY